jgi:hypothetical protein
LNAPLETAAEGREGFHGLAVDAARWNRNTVIDVSSFA